MLGNLFKMTKTCIFDCFLPIHFLNHSPSAVTCFPALMVIVPLHTIFDPVSIKYLCRKTDDSLGVLGSHHLFCFATQSRAHNAHAQDGFCVFCKFRQHAHFMISNRMIYRHHMSCIFKINI